MRTIKILSAGPIRAMGMVHGPILTPYTVDDNKLRAFLREGLNVVEILPNGSEVKLTIDDVNSSKPAPKKEVHAPKVAEPVESETVVAEPVADEPAEVIETPASEQTHNKKNKKR